MASKGIGKSCTIMFLIFLVTVTLTTAYSGHMIHKLFGLSFQDCNDECTRRKLCASVSYNRRYSFCALYTSSVQTRGVFAREQGSGVFNTDVDKYNVVLSLENELCVGCGPFQDCFVSATLPDAVCEVNMCDPLNDIIGARMFGNSAAIGSKVMYVCLPPYSDVMAVVTCGEDGNWTETNISCTNCAVPEVDNGTVTLSWLDDERYQAHVICDDDLVLREAGTSTRLTVPGTWNETLLNVVCCDRKDTEPWKLLYRVNSGNMGSVSVNFLYGRDYVNRTYLDDCQFRDNSIFTRWTDLNISRVKLELIKDDRVAAFMIFDGAGSTREDWMSFDRLLNSSWPDLMAKKLAGEPVMLSFEGLRIKNGAYNRFIVMEALTIDPRKCDVDVGWMLVTKHNRFPCHNSWKQTGLRIVYSEHGSTKFEEGPNIWFADKMEIHVEYVE